MDPPVLGRGFTSWLHSSMDQAARFQGRPVRREQTEASHGADCLFEEVQQGATKGQAVNALCEITGLNRAGFYRWRTPRQATPVKMELRDQMQKVALKDPAAKAGRSPGACSRSKPWSCTAPPRSRRPSAV
jgi:hypothetical protein